MVEVTDYFEKEEIFEEATDDFEKTGYPQPLSRYKLLYCKANQNLEEPYFWLLNFLKHGPINAFAHITKITDIFAASENSAIFGSSQSRLGLQQDKVSNFLATIGKMVKELFQVVRELRVIDERMELYTKSYEGDHASDIALKGYWIDLVEGGAKNPASVYGMSRELQFSTLPDLFFNAKPMMKSSEVSEYVKTLDFNRKVKEVLMRKLKTYLVWKENTFKELKTRRKFTLKYLRQHWNVINMYSNWVKPYLMNIRRMQMKQKGRDANANIISSFDTSVTEIEFLACNQKPDGDKYLPYVLFTLWFRTRPRMDIHHQEYHNKGPIHVGKLIMSIRSYAWTEQDLNNFKAMKEAENLELLGFVDTSVKDAMEALGDELKNYLTEAGEENLVLEDENKGVEEKINRQGPFLSVVGGFSELFGSLFDFESILGPKKEEGKTSKKSKLEMSKEFNDAKDNATGIAWTIYKIFKKAHGILSW